MESLYENYVESSDNSYDEDEYADEMAMMN